MFERDWFCWRELSEPTLFGDGPRVWISHPTAKGFTIRRQEGRAPLTVTEHPCRGLAAAIKAYGKAVDALGKEGLFELARPRVFERTERGKREAMLVRYPSFCGVEWVTVDWDAKEPFAWKKSIVKSLAAAFEAFDDKCDAAREQGFREWVPAFPQGFEAFLEAASYTERTRTPGSGSRLIGHVWYDAPKRPDNGPELQVYDDGSRSFLFQIDGLAVGLAYHFDAERCIGVIGGNGPRYLLRDDHRLGTVAYVKDGFTRLLFSRDGDGWSVASRFPVSRARELDTPWLDPEDCGPFDIAAQEGVAGFGAPRRALIDTERNVCLRTRISNEHGELVRDDHYRPDETLERQDTYDPPGTLRSRRFFESDGTLVRGEIYHPNGVVKEHQRFDAERKLHGAIQIYDDAGLLTRVVHFEHGTRTSDESVWPDVAAALAGEPSLDAFRSGCLTFARAYARDPARACAESLVQLRMRTADWPASTRAAPPYWINRISSGELPLEALHPIAALRLSDLALDEANASKSEDEWTMVEQAELDRRLSAFATWLASLPDDDALAVDVLDLSLTAWADRGGPTNASLGDFDGALFRTLLASPLARRLVALNVSRPAWDDDDPGNHDSYLDAERRCGVGVRCESFDAGPTLLESLAAAPCASTLQTLVAQSAELRAPQHPVRLPALTTLDVGLGSGSPNELLGSLASGWAPLLETLLVQPSSIVKWAIRIEHDPDAQRAATADGRFFGHDYCCEPVELLTQAAVAERLVARAGVPKLKNLVMGAECARIRALSKTKSRQLRTVPPERSLLQTALVPW